MLVKWDHSPGMVNMKYMKLFKTTGLGFVWQVFYCRVIVIFLGNSLVPTFWTFKPNTPRKTNIDPKNDAFQ